jgi:hypothetical protein
VKPAAAVGALVLAGCGAAGDSGQYAELVEYEAREAAQDALVHDVNDPESALYHQPVPFKRMYKGRTADGKKAWVAVYGDFAGEPVCVYVRARKTAFGSTYYSEIDNCASQPMTGTATQGNPA